MSADLASLLAALPRLDVLLAALRPLLPAILPWALVGVALLCALVALLRGAGAGALRRQMIEMDHGLRHEIAAATRESLVAAFDRVQQGQAAMQAAQGAFRTQVSDTLHGFGATQARLLDTVARALRESDERTQRTLTAFAAGQRDEQERLRALVGAKLDALRAGNETKLEAMRAAVDEKLQAVLEKRIGESFARVTEQFAEVQKAIGQVQSVAAQVGDLKRLFSNVKTRGGWGESQVEGMLQDALPPGSFERNMRHREGSAEAVDFSLRLPARDGPPLWLPIDSKFPTEDYDRLLLAADSGSRDDEAAARRGLEARIRLEARRIAEKYIVPPHTVEFAVLYLPTDGLFAEIARTPGLIEQVRREHRVMVMGPSLLPAFLHTVRIGHLTFVLERKAAEIADTLRAVKSEWDKLGGALDTLSDRAEKLTKGIEETRLRTRAVGRTLRGFEALESATADRLLGLEPAALAEETDRPPA